MTRDRAGADAAAPTVVILAKAPRPGRSKTRLAPAFGPDGAAALAAAALQDTIDAVRDAPAARRVLALDGAIGAGRYAVHVPPGFDVVPQAAGTHAERIAAALGACRGPALLIGMDTPQVTPGLLTLPGPAPRDRPGADAWLGPAADAWLGPAADGGWWLLGLRAPHRWAAAALDGVPMSVPWTGRAQHARLRHLGLRVAWLPRLRDVDTPHDADAVARAAPATRFARTHARLAAAAAAAGRAARA